MPSSRIRCLPGGPASVEETIRETAMEHVVTGIITGIITGLAFYAYLTWWA